MADFLQQLRTFDLRIEKSDLILNKKEKNQLWAIAFFPLFVDSPLERTDYKLQLPGKNPDDENPRKTDPARSKFLYWFDYPLL